MDVKPKNGTKLKLIRARGKLVLFMSIIVCTSGLTYFDKITPEVFSGIVIAIIGLYRDPVPDQVEGNKHEDQINTNPVSG